METCVGTWIYRLGPNILFSLHLEVDENIPNRLQGYLLHPEHFELSTPGGSVIRFSNIANESKCEKVVSTVLQNGALHLKDGGTPTGPDEPGEYLVRVVDSTHIDFSLFLPCQPIRMERATGPQRLATDWDAKRIYSPDDYLPDNPQMAHIVAGDQKDRKNELHMNWQRVNEADEERRIATTVLLREGKLHSGQDYESAALVFQHGGASDDYLLAHALAVVAISKGQRNAVWIAAATMDRYLQSINQRQIFGTQFANETGKLTTQEPYDRDLISDTLRGYMGVPSRAEQEAQRKKYDEER